MSGIILPDTGERAQLLQRAAELLGHVNASAVGAEDVELLPYFPPEQDRIRIDSRAA